MPWAVMVVSDRSEEQAVRPMGGSVLEANARQGRHPAPGRRSVRHDALRSRIGESPVLGECAPAPVPRALRS